MQKLCEKNSLYFSPPAIESRQSLNLHLLLENSRQPAPHSIVAVTITITITTTSILISLSSRATCVFLANHRTHEFMPILATFAVPLLIEFHSIQPRLPRGDPFSGCINHWLRKRST